MPKPTGISIELPPRRHVRPELLVGTKKVKILVEMEVPEELFEEMKKCKGSLFPSCLPGIPCKLIGEVKV